MQVEDAIWPYHCSWLHANVHLPVLPSHFVYKETTRFAFFQVQLQQYGRVCVAIRVVKVFSRPSIRLKTNSFKVVI